MELEPEPERQLLVNLRPRSVGEPIPAEPTSPVNPAPEPVALHGERPPWFEPMQLLAEALVRAVSLNDVAAAVVTYGTAATGARCAHVILHGDQDSMAVSLVGGHAVPTHHLKDPKDATVNVASPWIDAAQRSSPITFRSTAELYDAYPELAPMRLLPSTGAVITTPLSSTGSTCGAVTFGFGRRGRLPAATRATVSQVASLAGHAVRRAVLYETEHHSAKALQRAFLPPQLEDIAGLSFASRYLPAGGAFDIGGDWYDVIALPGPKVGLIIGDVAGHGIQAARIMAALRSALRAFATVDPSPGQILSRLNAYTDMFKPDEFATVLVGIFDSADGRLRYASAGHPPPIVIGEDGSSQLLSGALNPPLGIPHGPYEENEQPFSPGCALVIYTDGLIERRGRDVDAGVAELARAATVERGRSPDELCDRIVFELLAGVELFDDAALLVAVRGGQSSGGS